MKLKSTQRWAIGAVALAVLIACSPRSPENPNPNLPDPKGPTLSGDGSASLAVRP